MKECCVLFLSLLLIFALSVPSSITSMDENYRYSQNHSTEIYFQSEPSDGPIYEPGVYPDGLHLVQGDTLNATKGGSYNVTGTFSISSGSTIWVVAGYKIVVYADEIEINGTLNCNGAGASGGGPQQVGDSPVSNGGGAPYANYGSGGGGGAYGGDGEFNYPSLYGCQYGQRTIMGEYPSPSDIYMGSGGAGGESLDIAVGGSGGNGGGCVYLESRGTLLVRGAILCNGKDGADGDNGQLPGEDGAGGGGGGSGGGILLYGNSVVISGSLWACGGDCGFEGYGAPGLPPIIPNGDDGSRGGFGGGGRIKILYGSTLNTTGSSMPVSSFYDSGTLFIYKVDDSLPLFDLSSPTESFEQKSATPIVVNITDLQPIKQIKYNWDDSTNTTILPGTSIYTLETSLPSSEGVHTLKMYAQDPNGFWNKTFLTFITDDTAPVIHLKSHANNSCTNSELLIQLCFIESNTLAQVLYTWDSSDANVTLVHPYDIAVISGDGSHILSIYARDAAGNWGSVLYSWVVDDVPPSVTSPSDFEYHEGTIGNEICWIFNDSNPYHYWITQDGLQIMEGDWDSGDNISLNVDGLYVGSYTYTIAVFDLADNIITDTVVVTVSSIPVTTTTTISTTMTSTTTTTRITTATTLVTTATSTVPTTSGEVTTTTTITSTTSTTQTSPTTSTESPSDYTMIIVIGGMGGIIVIVVIIVLNRRKS